MIYYAPTEEEETAPLVKDGRGRYWERYTPSSGRQAYCSRPLCANEAHFLLEVWRCIATRYTICDDCLRQKG